ncbi:MAG: tetratricopeptide repeat protein [Nitritalea sp.]
MKKLLLSLAIVVLSTAAFAQKKVVRSANKNFKKDNLEVALQEIQEAAAHEDTKDDPGTYLLKAQILTKMFDQYEEYDMQSVEKGRNAFNAFMETMKMVDMDQNSKIGKDVYKEEIPGMPDNLRPYSLVSVKLGAFQRAIDTYEEDDFEMAYEYFALAADIEPTDTTLNFNAGFLANDLGKPEEAKKFFNRLLEVDDYDKLNAYYFLIQMAVNDNDTEGAYDVVSKARTIYPEDKTLTEFEIQLLLQMDKLDEAVKSVEAALVEDPDNVNIRLRYGYLKEQSGDIDGALEQYKKTVESQPDFFEGNFYTGALYLDKARQILSEINDLSDDEWEKRAPEMTEQAENLYKEAVPYFERAVAQKEDNTEILEILYNIHSRLKNDAEAEKYNKRLVELLGPDWLEG